MPPVLTCRAGALALPFVMVAASCSVGASGNCSFQVLAVLSFTQVTLLEASYLPNCTTYAVFGARCTMLPRAGSSAAPSTVKARVS